MLCFRSDWKLNSFPWQRLCQDLAVFLTLTLSLFDGISRNWCTNRGNVFHYWVKSYSWYKNYYDVTLALSRQWFLSCRLLSMLAVLGFFYSLIFLLHPLSLAQTPPGSKSPPIRGLIIRDISGLLLSASEVLWCISFVSGLWQARPRCVPPWGSVLLSALLDKFS